MSIFLVDYCQLLKKWIKIFSHKAI